MLVVVGTNLSYNDRVVGAEKSRETCVRVGAKVRVEVVGEVEVEAEVEVGVGIEGVKVAVEGMSRHWCCTVIEACADAVRRGAGKRGLSETQRR